MALAKCTECGGGVSSRAKACPHCGAEHGHRDLPPRWLMIGGGAVMAVCVPLMAAAYIEDAPLLYLLLAGGIVAGVVEVERKRG